MRRRLALVMAALALVASSLGFAVASGAQNVPGEKCNYALETGGLDVSASAEVKIEKNGDVRISIKDGQPNSLYTVWIDFRNRALNETQTTAEAMADDYPIAHNEQFDATVTQYGEGVARGVAPAFASTQGVTAGMGLDANTIVTDDEGKGSVELKPDYHVLQPGASPVVAADLVEQDLNRVGGGWMRQYEEPVDVVASLQKTDPATGLPLLVRATAQGITIVRHPDMISHGHTPGIGGVDHFSAFKGDYPDSCLSGGDDGDSDDGDSDDGDSDDDDETGTG